MSPRARLDPHAHQRLLAARIGLDREPAGHDYVVHTVGVSIDDHVRDVLPAELFGDDAANAAVAADDEMFGEIVEHVIEPPGVKLTM